MNSQILFTCTSHNSLGVIILTNIRMGCCFQVLMTTILSLHELVLKVQFIDAPGRVRLWDDYMKDKITIIISYHIYHMGLEIEASILSLLFPHI